MPPPTSPGGAPLAEFSDRLLARLIDGAILGGLSMVVILPIYLITFFAIFTDFGATVITDRSPYSPSQPDQVSPGAIVGGVFALMALVLVLAALLAYLYEVELMFRSGQTFGKRIMKIRIVPVDPSQPMTRLVAFKRFFVQHGSSLAPGLGLVDGLWQLWDKPWRQCLHDKFARTLVIKLNP